MKNSKLVELCSTFSARDWNAFNNFLASPYFNRNTELVRLVDLIQSRAPDFEGLGREEVWSKLYPEKPLDNRQLNHLMSWALKLGEQFVGLEQYTSEGFDAAFHSAEALLERGLYKHFRFNVDSLHKRLEQNALRDGDYFLKQYQLTELEIRAGRANTSGRHSDDRLQLVSNQLDFFYFTEKLRYACNMLNNQSIISTAYQFHFVDELVEFIGGHPFPAEAPGVALYYHIFQMLVKENGDSDFQMLKQLLRRHGDAFSRSEMAWLYEYALNFCIRQIRNVREEYVAEALQLYEQGIQSGILLDAQGRLSPWHFKNIVKLGLRVQRFEWIEQFILEKSALLEPEFKTDALHYNLADLYFYTGRYDDALEHLRRVEFTDVHYNLGAKEMLAKIYYETEAFDALDSLLHAFKTYLHRNRIINDAIRKTYLNFIRLLRRLLQTTKNQATTLENLVGQTDPLTAKNWLIDQIHRLK